MLQRKCYTRATLALDIVGKLNDGEFAGYHELGIIKHLISLHDMIGVDSSPQMTIFCDNPALPTDKTNLCWKAADVMRDSCGVDEAVTIYIEKRIPVEGGLAGGSANAATVMMLLNQLWKLDLTTEQLCELGRKVGMDVPYYFLGGTSFDSEAGGDLSPVETDMKLDLVLCTPGFGVSTKAAYGKIDYNLIGQDISKTRDMQDALRKGSLKDIAPLMHNDFEKSVFPQFPQLAEIKNRLIEAGCLNSILSGSGSTMIGLAESPDQAAEISRSLDLPTMHVRTACSGCCSS